jgi:type IV pilus assembly protein PilW
MHYSSKDTPPIMKQKGLTLIELMVAMALSLFLLLALAQLFLTSRTGDRNQQNLARMQESGRIGIEFISRELRKVGYIADPFENRQSAFPVATGFAESVAVAATTSTISMRLQSPNGVITQDCQGAVAPIDTHIYQSLAISTPATTGSIPDLECGVRISDRTGSTGTLITQTLVPNIEAMSILVGVDTDNDLQVDSYVAPSAVADWTRVVSINVQLRVASSDDFLSPDPVPYRDFANTLITPGDRRLRRVFGTVITLRNLVP